MYEYTTLSRYAFGPLFTTYLTRKCYQFDDNDRTILEGHTEGFVKIHVKRGTDRIIGATIVGEGAGDMIRFVLVVLGSFLAWFRLVPYFDLFRQPRKQLLCVRRTNAGLSRCLGLVSFIRPSFSCRMEGTTPQIGPGPGRFGLLIAPLLPLLM